jgi:glycerophosphoryl diester phosphodiesterase
MKVKKIILWSVLTKIPIIIYLAWLIVSVPAIDSVSYERIYGAHRGDSVLYLENTIEAIKSALENEEYKFIEFDIQYTKDKKIVVFHDGSLLRLYESFRKIKNMNYSEIWEATNGNVPLYSEIIDLIGNRKKINIEIKSSGDFESDKELVDFVVSDLRERGILENVMISSISRDVVKYLTEKYPEIKTGQVFLVVTSTYFNYDFLTEKLYEEVEETGADYLLLHGSNIYNIESLIELKPKDKIIGFWYFSNEIYIVQADEEDGLW